MSVQQPPDCCGAYGSSPFPTWTSESEVSQSDRRKSRVGSGGGKLSLPGPIEKVP